jgi:hypothetical protein
MSMTSIIEVHGHAKQGAGFRLVTGGGLNTLLATVSTSSSSPVVVAQRLRKGSCGSPRGAARLVADGLKTATTLTGGGRQRPLLRAGPAFYGRATIGTAVRAGADNPRRDDASVLRDDVETEAHIHPELAH